METSPVTAGLTWCVQLLRLEPHARELDCVEPAHALVAIAETHGNDARWMRSAFGRSESLQDLMWQASRRWRGEAVKD